MTATAQRQDTWQRQRRARLRAISRLVRLHRTEFRRLYAEEMRRGDAA